MSKYTPGPWKWAGDPGESDLMHGSMIKGNCDSCVMRYEKYEGLWFSDYGVDSRDVANALLIAAAPDLLEALESLVRAVDSKMPDAYMSSLSRDVHHVIAQAKGES